MAPHETPAQSAPSRSAGNSSEIEMCMFESYYVITPRSRRRTISARRNCFLSSAFEMAAGVISMSSKKGSNINVSSREYMSSPSTDTAAHVRPVGENRTHLVLGDVKGMVNIQIDKVSDDTWQDHVMCEVSVMNNC